MSTIAEEVQQLWEHNKALFPTPPRKIQVQRAGSHCKVRFEGEANFVFCRSETSPSDIRRRLLFFDGKFH